jgi:hypothetical protein
MLDIFTQTEILSAFPSIDSRYDWPEGAVYRYDRRGHELLRIVRQVDAGLAAAVAGEPVEIALLIDGPLVVVCSKIGGALPWAGASYHWQRVRNSDRIMPATADATVVGSRLDLLLLEAMGGRVRAIRPLTLPVEFTRVLHEAILDQARYTYNPGEERRAMETLLRRCPSPDSLVGYASVKVTLKG